MESKATEAVRKRYDRIAPTYDAMEFIAELAGYEKWRKLLWDKVEGKKILEVGVGTGKNFSFYPAKAEITAIDFSVKMLARARLQSARFGTNVDLQQMDVQKLEFPDNTFDTVLDSFVFCSVPDPILGLREVERVCKPGGKVLMLEHMLSANRIVAAVMNMMNPMMVLMMGANINRKTVENVAASGLEIEKVTELGAGIFKLIEARKKIA
jgi:phosphatidylethanolamine/phosphatidyl-N-methylethanolamine N-methyltransferase